MKCPAIKPCRCRCEADRCRAAFVGQQGADAVVCLADIQGTCKINAADIKRRCMSYLYIGIILFFLAAIIVIAMTMDEEDMKK